MTQRSLRVLGVVFVALTFTAIWAWPSLQDVAGRRYETPLVITLFIVGALCAELSLTCWVESFERKGKGEE